MTENPYQPPESTAEAKGVLSGSREDLRTVAKCQKGIMVCILIYLGALAGQFAVPPQTRQLIAFGVLGVILLGAVLVFILAIKIFGTSPGILLGVLSLIPFIGLIGLTYVNGKATEILNQNGIRVGLLGADLSEI